MTVKYMTVAAAALAAAACASTPKEETPPPANPVEPAGVKGPAPGTVEDFMQSAGERVFFAFDSYALSGEAQSGLKKQAAWLQSYPNVKIVVEGHCDERGTREYNLALGNRRANAAKDYLVGLGVSPDRITTITYGKEKPLDPRSTPEAWDINRNAHTVIVSGAVS